MIVMMALFICFTTFATAQTHTETFGGTVEVTESPPIVLTNASTPSSHSPVTLNGYLLTDGGLEATVGFEWGKTIAYGNEHELSESYEAGEEFSFAVSVEPEETYHFRAFAENSEGRVNGSDKTFTTLNPSYINETTSISETSATLNGYMAYGGDTVEYGFWLSTESPTPASPGTNVTKGSSTSATEYFSYISDLSAGQYYYVKSWAKGPDWFRYSSDTEHFITNPGQPTDVYVEEEKTLEITLSWARGDYSVSNYRTIVRYSDSGYPSSLTGGEGGCNTTDIIYTFDGLEYETTYYFSLWSYINDSGSPLLHEYSEFPAEITGTTIGGEYNLFVRYENETNNLINLSKGMNHEFIIHYTDAVETIVCDNMGLINESQSTANVSVSSSEEENGTICFNATQSVSFIEFYWNGSKEYDTTLNTENDYFSVDDDTTDETKTLSYIPYEIQVVEVYNESLYGHWSTVPEDMYEQDGRTFTVYEEVLDENSTVIHVNYQYYEVSPMRCKRTIVPSKSETNITFYTLIDKMVYGESQMQSLKDSLAVYTFSFLDETGLFRVMPSNHPVAYIYTQNSTGDELIIDSQYFTSSLTINPWLLYQKTYSIRVDSEQSSSIDIGPLSASSSLQQEIRIPMEQEYEKIFNSIVKLQKTWTSSGFSITYEDLTSSTDVVNFSVYHVSNKTLVYTTEEIRKNNHVFDFTADNVPYLDTIFNNNWYFVINCAINESAGYYAGEYTSGYILMSPYEKTDKREEIDDIWKIIFGDSPMYDYEGTNGGAVVPWTYILLFGLSFMVLLTFSKVNAFAGALACGIILVFGGVSILGMNAAYHWYSWWQGPSIAVIGIFILAIGIIGLMGQIDIRRY